MVTIIHGEDVIATQKIKLEISKKELIELENPDATSLKQAVESNSLFGEEKTVYITGKFENLKDIINSSRVPIYIFSDKTLSNKILSQFPKARVILNKPKGVIFEFLESIRPNNTKNILNLYKKLNDEPELVFYMLIRQFRNLIIVSEGSWTAELSPWQKNKLLAQSKYFSLEKLLKIYNNLEKTDYENKTGQTPLELSKNLELFLLSI